MTPPGDAGRPWLRTELPLEERVEALLAEMTLAEKVGQTHQNANIDPVADRELIRSGGIGSSVVASGATAGNERDAGIDVSALQAAQRIAVEESRLGVPLLFARDVIHGHRTVFPIPLGLAATWDWRESPGPSHRWSTCRRSLAGAGSPSRREQSQIFVPSQNVSTSLAQMY